MPTIDTKEEIKSRLDIVQVVSGYLELKRAGTNLRAPCPFHNEKDPSFYVSPERQTWHCFGCNEGGDIFSFVMKIEGLDFRDALKHLAEKAGVEIGQADRVVDKMRERNLEANALAARFYHEVLQRLPSAQVARDYASRRGLLPTTLAEFMIGYAPLEWDGLIRAMATKGFRPEELVSAGLAIRSDRGGYFDRFRNRLMFPIRDANGHVVAFTGRIMPGPDGKDPAKEAKYVNSPETDLYRKGQILFALDAAKQHIRRAGVAVVVEGNMDAVASHQADVRNVIASSGTAFTADHLHRLSRLCQKLILSFDMDDAGQTAARRSIDAAVTAGFEVSVLRLPPGAGKDPDDCIRKDPELWKQAIADARPYMQWYLETAAAKLDRRDPYAKRRAAGDILVEIAKLASPVEQSHWLHEAAVLFETPEDLLAEQLRRLPRGQQTATTGESRPAIAPRLQYRPTDRQELVPEFMMGLVLNWPNLAPTLVEKVSPEWLVGIWRDLYDQLAFVYNESQTGGTGFDAKSELDRRLGLIMATQDLAKLQLLAEKEFGGLTPGERQGLLDKLIGETKSLHSSRRQRELTVAMRQAEQAHDQAAIQEIARQLNELIP